MALPPRFAGQKLLLSSSPSRNLHTIELYLDYVCPFSAKQFLTLYPQITTQTSKPWTSNVQFIFRPQIQPWHPSSTLVHEAGVAVLRLAPEKFWSFSQKLFERQTEFFDVSVVKETRNEIYKRLAELGKDVGVDAGEMYKLLEISDKPGSDGSLNSGNGVTDEVKVLVKMARLTGVHVSPTVLLNGVVDGSVSSSFTLEDWDKYLTKNCS